MSSYDIEIGEESNPSSCHCCDKKSCTGHGFVYKDGDAYAVYYAGWSDSHSEKKMSLALAVGEWNDNSTSDDRTCFGLEAYEAENDVLFRVIEPQESPWPETDLMGTMISREQGLSHSQLSEVFTIAEEVLRSHAAIRNYLNLAAA
jgi:hypothetical protein